MSETLQITGGGGSKPGGSSGDIQFNNAGVLGGETLVPLAHGGTAADLSASGSATAFLAQDASHVISARSIVAGDLPFTRNVQTGSTYAIADGDRGKLVVLNYTSGNMAASIAQAGTAGAFADGWFCDIYNASTRGAKLTPTTSTIGTAAAMWIPPKAYCRIYSDGSNYLLKENAVQAPGWFFGWVINPPASSAQAGSFVGVSNRVYVVSFVVPFHAVVGHVSINVVGGVASSHVNCGLYDGGKDLVVDSGAYDTSTTGIKTAALASTILLLAGTYWLAQSSDSTSSSLSISYCNQNATGNNAFLSSTNVTTKYAFAANSTSGGALPPTLGALTASGTTSEPIMALFEP